MPSVDAHCVTVPTSSVRCSQYSFRYVQSVAALKDKVLSLIDSRLDQLQFAYQAGKDVDDAKLFILDRALRHLEKNKSQVILLFADFSSAFNKMQPHILIEHLASYFMLPDQILLLLLNFLTDRVQSSACFCK